MALDQDAKLFDVLAGGYTINTQLQALLSRPLDIHGQQEAMALSQELSRVFVESMTLLNSSTTVMTTLKTATEIGTGDSAGTVSIPARDKRIRNDSREVVTPPKKNRQEVVTRKEVTPSPYKDGYEWRKYGQKNIQNCKFVRYYFKCSRDRRCEAKKKVQQQEEEAHQLLPLSPMFEVTYVNEHTCHQQHVHRDNNDHHNHRAFGVVDTASRNDGGGDVDMLDPRRLARFFGGGAEDEENQAIVSCLAAVISSPPSPSPSQPAAIEASASGPAACYAPPLVQQQGAGHSAASVDGSSVGGDDDGTMVAMMMAGETDTGFSWDLSAFWPAAGEGDEAMGPPRHVWH